ncbi:ABC transporter permease [Streptomyces sp. NPDC047002]|uniref:ABC transporter permease n=1 Tax=Streptomyces sp. NPDC047002 TaxID=3155475 RepID=UPI003451CF42
MFVTYLRRELRRRRKAALVVASGLALGIALVIVVSSVTAGMNKAQDKVLTSLYGLGTDMTVTKAAPAPSSSAGTGGGRPRFDFRGQADDDKSSQSTDRVTVQGFQTLADTTVTQVGKQHGVAAAAGGLSLNVLKVDGQFKRGEAAQGEGGGRGGFGGGGAGGGTQGQVQGGGASFSVDSCTVFGTDVTDPALGPLTSSKITSGRTFKTSETGADVAVVDSGYAKQKKLAVGKSLTVHGTAFTIVGLATAYSGDAAANVYIPLAKAQALADAKAKVTTVYVKASDSQQIGAVKAAVQKNVPGTTVTTSADLASTVSGSLSTASGLASDVGRWLSVAVLVAAFLVAGLLTSSAVSRRVREFGTLKVLGWTSGSVTRQVMGEALVNGLIGGVLGIALGLAGAYAVTAISPSLTAQLAGGGSVGGGFAGRFGGGGGGGGGAGGPGRQLAAEAVHVSLTAPVSLGVIAVAVALAVAGGLVAGGFGGWRASRLRPADALRRIE